VVLQQSTTQEDESTRGLLSRNRDTGAQAIAAASQHEGAPPKENHANDLPGHTGRPVRTHPVS